MAATYRVIPDLAEEPQKLWVMDLIHDYKETVRRLKVLSVIDPVNNVSSLIHINHIINVRYLVELLESICEEESYPQYIQCDNDPEFQSKELDKLCLYNSIEIIFSRPDKPTDNCHTKILMELIEMSA